MDGSTVTSIIVILVLILFSAYFSATETAFTSLNLVRVTSMAKAGKKRASLVMKLSEQFDKLLSTILVGNNIVNIAATSMTTVLFVELFGSLGATLSTVVLTIVLLIFGEVSPKSIAKEAPEKVAMFSAPMLKVFMVVLTPVNFLFAQWKKLLSKVMGQKDSLAMTEEELRTMVTMANQEGAIDAGDKALIESALLFGDQTAEDILTPRVDIVGVRLGMTPQEVAQLFVESGYSRLPVYEDSLDRIVGVLHLRDVFAKITVGHNDLMSVAGAVVHVAPTTRISALLKLLQQKKTHIAVVADEHGGTQGIITLEDILEELVGEIWDEHDEAVEPFVEIATGVYRVQCDADVEDLFALFHLQAECHSSRVSGWVMEKLGRVPVVGDSFSFQNVHVTVDNVENHRPLVCTIRVESSVKDVEA